MTEIPYINWHELSDDAFLKAIGQFVKETRLQQNKNQQQVANAAGISRSTLSLIENGQGGSLLTFIQIMRVLNQMSFLNVFKVEEKASPIYLTKLEMKKRKRARNKNTPESNLLPDW